MARGQAGAAEKQLGKTNSVAEGQQQKSDTLESNLIPGYTSLMNTGYMNPAEEHAATVSEMGAATQPFESMNFEASNRAARTNNAADLTAQQDALALEEGRTAGDTAAGLQKQKMQNQEAGMYGLEQLQAGNQKEAESMYGLGPASLQARAAGKSGDENAMGWTNTVLGAGSK